nr:integrase, catalytic region, zinc finger, CCHC-type, peptidase aspartic, catalytic [Tanacetum cinerariifolium]
VQVPVNSAGTPSSTTIDQDAPSASILSSSSALQSPSLHQGVTAKSTLVEDNLIAPVDNTPFINVFALEPSSDASSSSEDPLQEYGSVFRQRRSVAESWELSFDVSYNFIETDLYLLEKFDDDFWSFIFGSQKFNPSCSKHMMGDCSRLMDFVKKFIGTVRFGNDHFGAIMGYGDYVIGDSVISRNSCYVRDTDGVELIKGSRDSNLYTISVED